MEGGLNCETSVPKIYDIYTSDKVKKLFMETGVLTEAELESRAEIYWETYCMKLEIEARTLADLAGNHVLPVAMDYQRKLLQSVWYMRQIMTDEEFKTVSAPQADYITELTEHITSARRNISEMNVVCDEVEDLPARKKALAYHDRILPYMSLIRDSMDSLELIVDDQEWPLPKYREMLFIR